MRQVASHVESAEAGRADRLESGQSRAAPLGSRDISRIGPGLLRTEAGGQKRRGRKKDDDIFDAIHQSHSCWLANWSISSVAEIILELTS